MRKALEKKTNEFFSHLWFSKLDSGELTREEILNFAVQYKKLNAAFPDILIAAMGTMESEGARTPFLRNLLDEYGINNNSSTSSHRTMYSDFLIALEASYDFPSNYLDEFPTTIQTDIYIGSMIHHSKNQSESEVLGLICFAESVAEIQCSKIFSYFQNQNEQAFFKEAKSLSFWKDHAKHDPYHLNDLLTAQKYISNFSYDDFFRGVETSFLLETIFWNGIISTS